MIKSIFGYKNKWKFDIISLSYVRVKQQDTFKWLRPFFCWFKCSCSTFYYIICCIYRRHIYMRLFSFWQRILLNFFCKTHINISFVFNGGHTNDPIKTKYSNNQLQMLKHTTIGCLWFHNLKLYPHFSWQTATKVCFERLHMMFFLVLIFIT